jgi:hypothetical protein
LKIYKANDIKRQYSISSCDKYFLIDILSRNGLITNNKHNHIHTYKIIKTNNKHNHIHTYKIIKTNNKDNHIHTYKIIKTNNKHNHIHTYKIIKTNNKDNHIHTYKIIKMKKIYHLSKIHKHYTLS